MEAHLQLGEGEKEIVRLEDEAIPSIAHFIVNTLRNIDFSNKLMLYRRVLDFQVDQTPSEQGYEVLFLRKNKKKIFQEMLMPFC